jgi:hypothetical protein
MEPAEALGAGDLLEIATGGKSLSVTLAQMQEYVLGGVPRAFRNVLRNGDFAIAQRGDSFATPGGGDLTLDGWAVGVTGASGIAYTVSQEAFTAGQTDVPGEPKNHIRWDHTTAGTADSQSLFQLIEGVRSLAGQTVTLSFYAKADAARTVTPQLQQNFGSGGSSPVEQAFASCALTTAWQKFTRPLTVASIAGKTIGTGDRLRLDFLLPTGAVMTIDIADVQLEVGTAATPFDRMDPAIELARCQRFYCALANAASAWAVATTDIVASVLFPQTMRAAPTVTLLDTTPTFNDFNADLVGAPSSIVVTFAVTQTGAQIRMDGFTGATVSRPGFFKQTTPIWAFDAEL